MAQKKINLSRHQAQEPLLRGMGVNCKAMTMPAVTDGFLCLRLLLRTGGGFGGKGGEKQFRQHSSKLSDGVILIH